MSNIFEKGHEVKTSRGETYVIEKFIGSGGQGEVYKASCNNQKMAIKWYYEKSLTQNQKENIIRLIEYGSPCDKFLWPSALINSESAPGFGYVMPLRKKSYKTLNDLMIGKVKPKFKAIIKAGFHIANSYRLLHARGLCYKDISFGNVFFDPDSGEILICDNDNVSINNEAYAGVLGTMEFMAPEIILGESMPNTNTDIYSLAVLLFFMMIKHHPLIGLKECAIHCIDKSAQKMLFGTDPVFIFDPNNTSNQPDPECQKNPFLYWPLYPKFLKDKFIRAFTNGLKDVNQRVKVNEWCETLIALMDSIYSCFNCGVDNFYDAEKYKIEKSLGKCWNCKKELKLPDRIKINNFILMLNPGTQITNYHVSQAVGQVYDIGNIVAEVIRHPDNPNITCLKNLSKNKWVFNGNETIKINPSESLILGNGNLFFNENIQNSCAIRCGDM